MESIEYEKEVVGENDWYKDNKRRLAKSLSVCFGCIFDSEYQDYARDIISKSQGIGKLPQIYHELRVDIL